MTMRAIVLALCAALATPAAAQTPDFAALPEITGTTTQEIGAGERALLWLTPAETGLYRVGLSSPGVLALYTFDTEDGRFDGAAEPRRLRQDSSRMLPPALADLLLPAGRPYLLVAQSAREAATLSVSTEALGTAQTPGEATPDGGNWSVLYRMDEKDAEPVWAGLGEAAPPLKLEAIAEPRAKSGIEYGRREIPPGGLWPMDHGEDTGIGISASVSAGPPPLVLLRASAAPEGYDEREGSSDGTAQPMGDAETVRGVFLPVDDDDTYTFTLDADATLDLKIAAGERWTTFGAELQRVENGKAYPVAERRSRDGGIEFGPLALSAGDWRLLLERDDDELAPVDYTISRTPAPAPKAGLEAEPNDSLFAAFPLSEAGTLRGSLAEDDRDIVAFEITEPDRLTRLFGVRGVERMILRDRHGAGIADVQAQGGRVMLDSLVLAPGRYTLEMRGEGDYAFKRMDLGAAPPDYERQPNGTEDTAQRLALGGSLRGTFDNERDHDMIAFRLDRETDIALTITAPDDGKTTVWLRHDRAPWGETARFEPGSAPYLYEASLPAGDYVLALRSDSARSRGLWQVSLERRGANPGGEPDHLPARLRAMPLDGDLPGRIGAFDGLDLIHIPLPEGAGQMAVGCIGTDGGDNPDWKLHTYGDAEQLASESIEPVGLPYDPALGGALRLSVRGGGSESGYRCMLRGVPDALPEAREAPEQEEPVTFTPGAALTGRFDDSRDFDELRLDLAENEIGLLHCRLGATADQPLPDGMVRWQGEILPSDPLEGFTLLRREPGAETIVTLRGDYAESTPESWTCALWGEDTLPRPADLGPMAEFTALTLRAPEDAPPQIAPPPQLLPGRPDWLPKAAATGDAPLEISVGGLETPLAAYARSGQAVAAEITVTNTGEAAVETALEARMLAEGWRISGTPAPLTLAPGESGTVSLSLEAPPLLSPAVAPALAVSARVGDAVAATIADVPLALDAPTLGARPHWSAPEALLGGLNVLDHALGARIIARDGKDTNEKFAQDYAFLHDGLAPHISTRTAFYRKIEFRLALEAPVAGAVLHLRSSMERASWPAGYEIALAGAGGEYEVVAEGRLTGSSAPQYIVFDGPKAASRLRLRVPGCQGEPDCNGPALQEIQAIAEPGWRLAEPPAISRPDVGGHVVWASDSLGGSWNNRVLTGERSPLSVLRANDRNGPVMSFAVAFHQNRAALIDRIDWVGHEKDKTRAEGAEVAYSIEGPGGPWQVLGQLPAPAEGEERATLALETPVWARYLRFVVTRAPKSTLAGPDRVEVFEAASGPSVLGLWEDDSPRAGYEYTHPATTLAAPAPAGGPDEGSAVPLPLDEAVASSVLLERNEDWWRLAVPEGPPQLLTLDFGIARGEYEFVLSGPEGEPIPLTDEKSGIWSAILAPGDYRLRVWEPPRSVVISWDTSGSVGAYIPKTLEAVRRWARALHPGRDALQLLPFGQESLALPGWAERPEEVEPYLATLEPRGSSDSEGAMRLAATALAEREGARGIVIITDAETSIDHAMWEQALKAQPRVVSLSIDSDSRQNAAVMMDWAAINGGLFHRVVGIQGLADGLDMAASLFRTPKPYRLTAALEAVEEPEGEATLVISATELEEGGSAQAAGAVEIILDASGSMLKRMEGRRRIAIAHDALSALVRETLPEGAPLAFRAFGLERDACRSELTIPLAPLDRKAAERAIRSVPAINLAKTAIARSLLAVREDLAEAAPPRVVVLVTDGEETCDGDVAAAIETLRADGFDVRVNIVGFAIDDAGLAETFASWAEAGGGQYFDAGDAAALGDAVTRAVSPRFAIFRERYDGTEERIGVIGLDEPLTVPAGRIRAEPAGAASGGPVRVELRDGEDATLGYAAQAGLSAP